MDASWHQASAPLPFSSLQKTKHSSRSIRPPSRSITPFSRILLFATLLVSCLLLSSLTRVGAEPAKPIVTENVIDYQARKLNYFTDSTVVLFVDNVRDTYRSDDEGKSWRLIEDVPKKSTRELIFHPFDSNIAYIITGDTTNYKTTDRGKTWSSFRTEFLPIPEPYVLSFHAKRPGWVIIHLVDCDVRNNCHQEVYYTKDGFDTAPKKLLSFSHICQWAISSENFDEAPTELIHCLYYKALRDDGSVHIDDSKLVKSQDFFETIEPVIFGSGDRAAIVHFVTKESYMLAAEKHLTTGDMTLYISGDAKTWAKAHFPSSVSLRQDAYTILESTSYSLILDVKASPMDTHGTLMISNSNGSEFAQSVQYTNRNERDIVDFEKIQNIDGVYIVNVVDNHEGSPRDDEKKIRTKISFEAGSDWQYILPPKTRADGRDQRCTPNTDGSCSLHLHSVTSAKVAPPVFSSKAAVGVVMGVGNVGDHLLPWADCDTYLSEDGGITWKAVLEHPHKYEFGDMGGLIVAIRDDDVEVSYFQFSADRGQTWQKQEFGDSVRPIALTSDPESTSQKFLIFAHRDDEYVAYHLDLTNVYGRKCELNEGNEDRSDFEKWYARNLRNNPDCLMGVKTWYYRRKANAECMVREAFTDPKKTDEVCPCTDEDFECDYNYILKDGECVLQGKEAIPEGSCKKEGETFLASSGYRKVPGNSCDSEKGIKKDEPKSKTCSAEHVSTDISHTVTKFDSAFVSGLQYFLRSSVVMGLTLSGQLWRSTDDGSTWKRLFPDVKHIRHFYLHDENEKLVYVITNEDIYVSHDRGENFDKHELPAPPNNIGAPLVDFHPDSDKNDWILYLGQKSSECFTRLYHSENAGRSWTEVDSWVDKAVYSDHRKLDVSDYGIFEIAWKKPMPTGVCQIDPISTDVHPRQMIYKNIGSSTSLVLFDHVANFYVIDKFLAVAVESGSDFVLYVSLNGHEFARSQFPPNMRVDRSGFNVLQSTTGSLVVDMAKSTVAGREYGRLFKSNSNGTFFSLQLDNTNRNVNMAGAQIVDWEKLGTIEGVIIANQVTNINSLATDGGKYVRTLMSFNDGSAWNPIRAPAGSNCDDCYLHLHGASEYNGPGAVFSASSSVGLVMGVGNVGEKLGRIEDAQTFLSRDAGRTWKKVSDKRVLYEFGDGGGVLVMVDPSEPTQEVSFSYDFGATWETTAFADGPVKVDSITTEPTSRTSKITISGIYVNGEGDIAIATLDFSNRRACVLDKRNQEKSDFEKWSPFEGDEDRCILGQEVTYWRRKPDRLCRVNDEDGSPDTEQANCECTKRDFECDIGYFMDSEGICQLYSHDPEKPKVCDGTYTSKGGYKKISSTLCKGGLDLEKKTVERQCKNRKPVESKSTTFPYAYDYERDTYFYFPNSDVCMIKFGSHVYKSDSDGKIWDQVEVDGLVTGLHQNTYSDNVAIIGTSGEKHLITQDRGLNWDPIKLPLPSASRSFAFRVNPWAFHPVEPSWIIHLAEAECDIEYSRHCHVEAFYTKDAGATWKPLAQWVKSCKWAQEPNFQTVDYEGIYCEQFDDRSVSQKTLMGSPVQLIYTESYMNSQKTLFDTIIGYATYSEYLVVAEFVPRQRALRVAVSKDGTHFDLVHYPSNFDIVNPGYTVLDSTTNSIFLSITVIDREGSKVGNLFTSNSNGTYLSLSRRYISENDWNNVDFEKMQGIDGVALMNEVTNPNEANQGEKKILRSLITVNNGKTWDPLNAPERDSDGNLYSCSGACTLHLHNYLDRKHVEDMFSSPTAPGLAIGIGNVGTKLTEYEDGNTFITRDGGHSWREILHGPYQYDFGDQGGIIVLFKDDERPTDKIIYSLDHGKTFVEYEFSEDKVILKDIVSKPNGIGKSFLLFAVPANGGSGNVRQVIYQIDFSGLDYPTCRLDLKDEANDDFERWNIADLRGEECTFGRKAEYYRRIDDRQCFIGELAVNPRYIEMSCQCTDSDFECDYNYEPDENKQCVLIKDAQPLAINEKEVCSNLPEGQNYYYESIGYRKMSFSTCKGDHRLFGNKKDCPGKGGIGFFGWVGILLASGGGAFAVIFLLGRYKSYFGGRDSFIRLGNDMYDQLPRSSSLPTVNMPSIRVPGSLSRTFRNIHVPDFVYQAWNKAGDAVSSITPRRLRGFFGGPSGYRYQNLSQEPGEVIMDDYFDHYLDGDDDDDNADAIGFSGDDAEERYRDEDDDDDDDGNHDLNSMA